MPKKIETSKFNTAGEVARHVGTSDRAVRHAIAGQRLRQEPDGTFTMEAVEEWVKLRKGGRSGTPNPHKARLEKAKADILEMERDELRGKLLRKADVERAFTDRAYVFSRSLLAMGRRIGPEIARKARRPLREVLAIFDEEARALLNEIANPNPAGK